MSKGSYFNSLQFFNWKSAMLWNKSATSDGAIKSKITSHQPLAEELGRPIIRKLKKCKVYSYVRDMMT